MSDCEIQLGSGATGWKRTPKASYLFLKEAVEDEDKHSLESVEYSEEVRHDDGGLVDEEEAEGPRETQQTQQGEGPHHPGSGGRHSKTHTGRRQTTGL